MEFPVFFHLFGKGLKVFSLPFEISLVKNFSLQKKLLSLHGTGSQISLVGFGKI